MANAFGSSAHAVFVHKLETWASALGSSTDPHLKGLGRRIQVLASEVESTGAVSWEDYEDRREALVRGNPAIPTADDCGQSAGDPWF